MISCPSDRSRNSQGSPAGMREPISIRRCQRFFAQTASVGQPQGGDLNTLLRSSDIDGALSHRADQKAKVRILARLTGATFGHFGDCEPVGRRRFRDARSCRSRVRVDSTRTGSTIYVLLAGRIKASSNKRHRPSETNGSRTQEAETMKKMKTTYKTFDTVAYLDNDEVIAEAQPSRHHATYGFAPGSAVQHQRRILGECSGCLRSRSRKRQAFAHD
jgi:putative component of toxin-antitoxin plasmid stabilization module